MTKLALSMLCENPHRRTGLTSLFHEFIRHALVEFPDVSWVIFLGARQPWVLEDPRIQLVRTFPDNSEMPKRLLADHFLVAPRAAALGAKALLTVGFYPARAPLPIVMHLFSLHHTKASSLRDSYRKWAVNRGLKKAALVIANSHWTNDQLSGPAPRIVSHEGLQHDRFHPEPDATDPLARAALNLPPEYLLWSSNFYQYKRAGLALRAFAALPADLRKRFPLVLVGGEWAGGLEAAKAEAEALGITSEVRFMGWIDDRWVPACYRGARALLLSTAEETFGRSVVEALACGCLVVTQDLRVLHEVSADAAYFTDFTDTPRAAEVVAKACLDETTAASLRAAGLARAKAFSFQKLVRERLTAILEMV